MINNIRYVEREVARNFGDSINDLEEMDYWELLKIVAAKGKDDSSKSQSNNKSSHMNAYDFLKNNPI